MRIVLIAAYCVSMLAAAGCGDRPPVYPEERWSYVHPKKRGLDKEILHKEMAALGPAAGHVVIVRGGEVVYSSGEISQPMQLFSASKSIVSLLCGRLLHLSHLDLKMKVPVESMAVNPPVHTMLSMTSNFELEPHSPGTHYAYNNHAYNFLGEYLREKFYDGLDPAEILYRELLSHIGGRDEVGFEGQWGGWGGGFSVSARDLARIGLLVLREGKWRDQQLLPAEFIQELYRPQVPADAEESAHRGPNDAWNQHHFTSRLKDNYSFGWWLGSQRDGVARHIRMSGRGGTFLKVHPELDLVIAVVNDKPKGAPDAGDYLKAVQAAM